MSRWIGPVIPPAAPRIWCRMGIALIRVSWRRSPATAFLTAPMFVFSRRRSEVCSSCSGFKIAR